MSQIFLSESSPHTGTRVVREQQKEKGHPSEGNRVANEAVEIYDDEVYDFGESSTRQIGLARYTPISV